MQSSHLRPSSMLEFWFEFGSCYSYLSVMRIEELARASGLRISWRPFLLGPIFKSFGWETPPFKLHKQKGAYVWRDLARLCAKYDLPWRQPSKFPRRALLPTRLALLGTNCGWIADFSRHVMLANFAADRDIDNPQTMSEVLEVLHLPATELLAAALSEDNKRRLRDQTETARQRGIFGAPTFLVGSEMFWGNDRLEDALSFEAPAAATDHSLDNEQRVETGAGTSASGP
jgi:2-hydroxychromene-2-carboxylate isomerase